MEDLSDGLWAAFHQLARVPNKSLKKVYIMTNDPGPADDEAEHDQCASCHLQDPCACSARSSPSAARRWVYLYICPCDEHRQRAISKATELKDAGAMLELLPMVPTGGQYQPRAFWAQLLELDPGTVVNIEAPDADAADGERQVQRGQLSVSFLLHCAHVLRL